MVRPRTVSQWGPNAQGVRSRPDRSVSLPDPRRAAAMGGAIWFYGGYGNPPQKQIGPNSWGAAESEYQKLADAVQKTAAEVGEAVDADNPDEVLDWLGGEPTWVEVTPEGTVVRVPEPDPEEWAEEAEWAAEAGFDPETGQWEVPDVPPAVDGNRMMQGLTADEAFRQHHAMAGGEPPREGRAHPERAPAPYEPVAPMSEEQKKINRKGIEDARRRLNPNSQMAGPDWEAIEEGDYGAGNWWDTVPGMDDLGDTLPDADEPLNPELRSMDSQMLADMMVSQPEQGYFGGLGDAVQGLTNRVAGMSGQERAALIAALVAAGLITVGSGGTLAPAGAALLGGAGLTALNQ